MVKQVRIALATAIATAIAKVNLHRAESGEASITMKALAVQVGVAAPVITRLARTDGKVASALSLDLASRIVTVLDCGIEDLLEDVAG
ncbi:helix-turn-helix domain-containing protein [Vulcanococcus limneticus]|uniref:helix-turn-helix domain-containing protein n=1 Tax=Vulcanococcus limneticus TaxID=2170428 RepID=UPI00398BD6B8